jgi:hypothetical protein
VKPRGIVGIILGALLLLFGLLLVIGSRQLGGVIPTLVGATLIYLGFRPGRHALAWFGHACIVAGCMLTTWGIYLLPHTVPSFSSVFTRPLFWGLFCTLGGVCANYHAFCNCMRKTGPSGCPAARADKTATGY